jgi:hypothetical protein
MPGPKARLAAPVLLVALALPLAACETTSDPLTIVTTAPGQYNYYDCPAIKVAAAAVVARQRQLEELMARANQGFAGGLISATTYQPEYVTMRGKLHELRRVAAENHCNFVPGEAAVVHVPPPAKKQAKRAKYR